MVSQPAELQVGWIAAAAACLAAFIAGIVSLVGLLISKETETSGFRQNWIDNLRDDVATLIAHANQIHAYFGEPQEFRKREFDYSEFWRSTRDNYLELNRASTRIKLRLNPGECDSRLILESMSELEELFKSRQLFTDPVASGAVIQKISDSIERNMPPLLKAEWKRVKSGEPIYRQAKRTALIWALVTAVLTALLVWAALRSVGI